MKEKTARELGFIPEYIPMTEEQTGTLASVILSKEKEINIPDEKLPFVLQILDKRIKAMNLPISFSSKGKLAALVLSDGNPGRMVAILIDCLTKHEGEIITDDKICRLYPWGFYTDGSFTEYVEHYLKPKKVKWSQIY